jgi:hypothetical protein
MAKRAASEVNKSQAIRDYKKEHPTAGPKEIAEALGQQGITTTAGFVSTILSNARRKAGKGKRKGTRRAAKAATSSRDTGSLETLMQAKRLADKMGGVAEAQAALEALAKIINA